MQDQSSKVNQSLTDYHYQRNEDALKAVNEMAKNPMSLEKAKEQVARLKNQNSKNMSEDNEFKKKGRFYRFS